MSPCNFEMSSRYAPESSSRTRGSSGGGLAKIRPFILWRTPNGRRRFAAGVSAPRRLTNAEVTLFLGTPEGLYLVEASGTNVSSTPRKRNALAKTPAGSSFRSSCR